MANNKNAKHKAFYIEENEIEILKDLIDQWQGYYRIHGYKLTEGETICEIVKTLSYLLLPDSVSTNLFKIPLEKISYITKTKEKKVPLIQLKTAIDTYSENEKKEELKSLIKSAKDGNFNDLAELWSIAEKLAGRDLITKEEVLSVFDQKIFKTTNKDMFI